MPCTEQATEGFNCVFKFGEDIIAIARDFDPSYVAADLDATARNSAGWEETLQGLKSWSASGEMVWVPTDEGLQALWAAYISGVLVAIEWMDENGYGRDGCARVVGFHPGPQGLTNAVMLSIDLKGSGAVTVVEPAS